MFCRMGMGLDGAVPNFLRTNFIAEPDWLQATVMFVMGRKPPLQPKSQRTILSVLIFDLGICLQNVFQRRMPLSP